MISRSRQECFYQRHGYALGSSVLLYPVSTRSKPHAPGRAPKGCSLVKDGASYRNASEVAHGWDYQLSGRRGAACHERWQTASPLPSQHCKASKMSCKRSTCSTMSIFIWREERMENRDFR